MNVKNGDTLYHNFHYSDLCISSTSRCGDTEAAAGGRIGHRGFVCCTLPPYKPTSREPFRPCMIRMYYAGLCETISISFLRLTTRPGAASAWCSIRLVQHPPVVRLMHRKRARYGQVCCKIASFVSGKDSSDSLNAEVPLNILNYSTRSSAKFKDW
jgi:hypothetical protein